MLPSESRRASNFPPGLIEKPFEFHLSLTLRKANRTAHFHWIIVTIANHRVESYTHTLNVRVRCQIPNACNLL